MNLPQCVKHNYHSGKYSSEGYTLIELMITVTLAALLGGLALPTFSNQAKKAKFIDAEIAISAALKRSALKREEQQLKASSLCSDLGLNNSMTPEWEYTCQITTQKVEIQANGTGYDSTITAGTSTGVWSLDARTGNIEREPRSF
jgi:prepilin-type N-terminal cleavage/methylation domain-containing protein